jgi:hypothetical protein
MFMMLVIVSLVIMMLVIMGTVVMSLVVMTLMIVLLVVMSLVIVMLMVMGLVVTMVPMIVMRVFVRIMIFRAGGFVAVFVLVVTVIHSAPFAPMIMRVRVGVILRQAFSLKVLQFRSQSRNVGPQSDLLGPGQLTENLLDVFRDRLHHDRLSFEVAFAWFDPKKAIL